MTYPLKVGLALDQLLNAILGGWPDESLSARAYRWDRDGKRSWPKKVINALFFWMKDHCKSSYLRRRSSGTPRRNTGITRKDDEGPAQAGLFHERDPAFRYSLKVIQHTITMRNSAISL